ncbi:MAG: NAD(P)-dependent alcohol dehydrogenase [Thermoplasmata archaeon]|nr:NAD(P)-dependent alcohol dehydrogenase [Thermoplasmata archaeon]
MNSGTGTAWNEGQAPTSMRAVVWTRYGPPEGLVLRSVRRPVPSSHEVLIGVHATGVAAGDCELRALRFSLGLRIFVRLLMGLARPRDKILGQEFAGVVRDVGTGVTRFQPGDRVYGTTGFRFGAYAEYLCLSEHAGGGALAKTPVHLRDDEAATVPTGALEALHFFRRAGDLRGAKVLINGAGGGIGIFAVQLAKLYGADVTAVDGPTKRDLLRSLGADQILDYTREEFARSAESYDVIFDVIGKTSYTSTLGRLTPDGYYLLGNPRVSTMLRGIWTSCTSRRTVVFGAARQSSEDLAQLRELLDSGQLRTVVDRTFPLEDAAEAHRYFETGAARGRVVLLVRSEQRPGEPGREAGKLGEVRRGTAPVPTVPEPGDSPGGNSAREARSGVAGELANVVELDLAP